MENEPRSPAAEFQSRTKLIEMAQRGDTTVLLTGPTGSGKTSLARLIHSRSSRRQQPFVSVNLATLHEGTLESELFGHERGAFTGAETRRVGRLVAAEGGTLFLDEIGELSMRLQARLLEFLQTKALVPVGGNRELKLDVRLIVATHQNLARAVRERTFREDLFHRIRILNIELPSLRERAVEFKAILGQCLAALPRAEGAVPPNLEASAERFLTEYSWPGNIRELKNVLEYAHLSAAGPVLRFADLPHWLFGVSAEHTEVCGRQSVVEEVPSLATLAQSATRLAERAAFGIAEIPLSHDYNFTLAQFEKEYLRRALSRNGGRINRTARQIGLNKSTLLRRVRSYGLSLE